MKVSTGAFAEASASWLSSLTQCCAPFATCSDEKPRRSKSSSTTISWPLGRSSDQDLLIDQDDEKQYAAVVRDQPTFPPRPVALPETPSPQASVRNRMPRKSFGSGRPSLSGRIRFWSDASSRRPQISAPSDFRHLNTSSFQFPVESDPLPAPRRVYSPDSGPYRPLELSIYSVDNDVSPILAHFDLPGPVPSPPPAYFPDSREEDQRLIRQRSYSSMSFHIPRKQHAGGSPFTIQEELPPMIPPRAEGRSRSYTAPEVESIKERVASAMIEVELLQRQIDDVVERQSLYANSRPSTSHSMARTMSELEPMPSIPALPPAAPSFAERLNSDMERPQTAPIRFPALNVNRVKVRSEEALATPENHSRARRDDQPPPPPLPLVLRPPLRKKKSFSRVSTWLFPGPEHNRNMSVDSVTNLPRPVKGREGFYQCVSPGEGQGRKSSESVDTVTTWETDDEERTVPTTWSPGSTPATKQEERSMERSATFGKSSVNRPGMASVGVAM